MTMITMIVMMTHLKIRVSLTLSLSLDSLDELSSGLGQDPGLSHHVLTVMTLDQLSTGHHDLVHDVRDLVWSSVLDMVEKIIESLGDISSSSAQL